MHVLLDSTELWHLFHIALAWGAEKPTRIEWVAPLIEKHASSFGSAERGILQKLISEMVGKREIDCWLRAEAALSSPSSASSSVAPPQSSSEGSRDSQPQSAGESASRGTPSA